MPKLTKRTIDAASYPEPGRQVFLRDEEVRGLAVRITHGSKSFVLEKEIRGRIRRPCLCCGRKFKAWDRRQNWRCRPCLIAAERVGCDVLKT